MLLKGRSIVSLEGLSSAEIERILQVAAQMKNIVISQNKKLEVNLLLHYFLKHLPEQEVLSNWQLSI